MKIIFLFIAASMVLTSCSKTGYLKKDGKWIYQFYAGGDLKSSTKPVHDADNATFEPIDKHYGKDKNSVFIYGMKIKGANPSSFKLLSEIMSKDKDHVYEDSVIVKGADPNTFVHIEEEFYKDKNSVFLKGQPIAFADPKTFEIIKYPYVKDKNNIFCGTVPLQVKDKASFKVTSSGGMRLYEDTEGFTLMSPEYKWMNTTKDYYPVFYVEDATAKTNTENFKNFKLVK